MDVALNPVEEQRQLVGPQNQPLRPNERPIAPAGAVVNLRRKPAHPERKPINWQPVVDESAAWIRSRTFTAMVLILFAALVFGPVRVGDWIESVGVGTVAAFVTGIPAAISAGRATDDNQPRQP